MSEWISVDERLPEDVYHSVNVYINPPTGIGFVRSGYLQSYYTSNKWAVHGEKGNAGDFVTHWMPLPSPPSEEV